MSDFRSGQPVRLFDEDNLPYTANNPLPVTIEESEGDEIHEYDESVDVLKNGGSIDVDYVVSVGKTFLVSKVLFSASGAMKLDLQIETGVGTDIFETKATGFTSSSRPNEELNLDKTLKVLTGVKVRLVKTNIDNDDQSLYSTLIGVEK